MGEVNGGFHGRDGGEDERVHEWELGLPDVADITPLSQGLIPPGLMSAFNIKPEPHRTTTDVAKASQLTISSLKAANFAAAIGGGGEIEVMDDDVIDDGDDDEMSEAKKLRRNESPEDADSAAVKRSRLVWTPQLHKRFVDVVAHLGIKNAVPKPIMQLMNVEGLTRENVASHLQKYRLYLKRMQGVNFETGTSSSSPPAAVEQLENGGNSSGGGHMPAVPVPMMIPMMGSFNGHHHHPNFQHHQQQPPQHHQQHHHHSSSSNHYNYFQNSHHYNNGVMQSVSGTKYGSSSVVSYHHNFNHPPHVAPGDKN